MGCILTAYQNKTPLIITAGQQTREMLLLEPYLTNIESINMPRPWVKWSYEPVRAEDVPAVFMGAYATAVQQPSGPVFLSLPLGDWDKEMDEVDVFRTVPRVSAQILSEYRNSPTVSTQAGTRCSSMARTLPAVRPGKQASPDAVFSLIAPLCHEEFVLVEESPSNVIELQRHFKIDKPDSFYTFASGALGWDMPAAVGLGLAEKISGRNRPVVAVMGDGSFQYSIQSIYTTVAAKAAA